MAQGAVVKGVAAKRWVVDISSAHGENLGSETGLPLPSHPSPPHTPAPPLFAGQNLLLALNYAHHGDSRLVCEAHEEWGRRFQVRCGCSALRLLVSCRWWHGRVCCNACRQRPCACRALECLL